LQCSALYTLIYDDDDDDDDEEDEDDDDDDDDDDEAVLSQAKKGRKSAVIPETARMRVNCESGTVNQTSGCIQWTHITNLDQLFNCIDKVEVMIGNNPLVHSDTCCVLLYFVFTVFTASSLYASFGGITPVCLTLLVLEM